MVEIAEGCRLVRLPTAVHLVLQGRVAALDAAAKAMGIDAPPSMLATATGSGGTLLRLGPFELSVLPSTEARTVLEAALAELPHSLVEVSNRNVAFELEGPSAADILATLSPLDFSLQSFPVGMATRTLLDKAGALIWRTAPQVFHVEIWRSFAPYIETQLREVGRTISFNIISV